MIEQDNDTIEWAPCNQCLRSTRHDVIVTRVRREQEDIFNEDGVFVFLIDWDVTYTVLECRGCGGVTLRRRVVCDELETDETTYYPPQTSRQSPRWLHRLPKDFRDLLKAFIGLA